MFVSQKFSRSKASNHKSHKGVTILRGRIVQRTPNCWAVVIYQGKDPDTGKERRKWYHFSNRKEAEAHLLQLANYPTGAGVGVSGSTRLRLGDFLKSWLRDDAKMAVGPLTYKRYRESVELHIAPELGHYPLARIGPQTIVQFYTKKLESGLAPATVKYMHVALNLGFKKAVEWDLIVRNPCDKSPTTKGAAQGSDHLDRRTDGQVLGRNRMSYTPRCVCVRGSYGVAIG